MLIKKRMYKTLVFLAIFAPCLWISCAKDIKYEDIGEHVAGPTAIAHFDSDYFYVLNSDFDQRYDTGSLLVLDHDGKKVKAIEAPRLGSNLLVSGNDLFAAFSADDESEAHVHIYDISDPANPSLQKAFDIDCNPINFAAKQNEILAVTCSNGDLYIGELAGTRSASTLKKVREYGYMRRAIFIDAARDLLFAFPTYDGESTDKHRDERLVDEKTYSDTGSTNTPNEIPDGMENDAEARNNLVERQRFRFVVYDLAAEKAAGFPNRANDVVPTEFRWLYFKLKGADGKYDYPTEDAKTTSKLYRTNFWSALQDPDDANSFFMSHRNPYAADVKLGNDVLRVTVKGNPRAVGSVIPALPTYLEFERVYGFKDEQPEDPFPASIAVQKVGGKDILLVNHFNNLDVTKEGAKFSLAQKQINATHSRYELQGQPPDISYYEMSIMPDGRTMAGSFFGHMVLMFDVDPDTNITRAKITKIK